ncbi:methyl-accepting chemotaxis protein [Variovorax sp. HJSM1_2]|uniref:methyl-accepting chemotaxis protein n=1 Tax=Variovorax sp. HJSM1_2 TaxID=3366263 RepID=UPI003BDE45B1
MRTNLPVSQREHQIDAGATLLSTTDLQSRVCYANAAFVQASGFDRAELMGEPHNLVRHPDMPRQAFADMWATLKSGQSWSALVKNRRRDGDHYWVRANATPVLRGEQVVGYMSVRTRPGAEEVAAAESLYQRFRQGRAGRLAFRQGLVVRTGVLALGSALQTLSLRWRINLPLLILWPLLLLAVMASGVPHATLLLWCAGSSISLLAYGLWLERQITRPLQLILGQARRVAAGQVTVPLQLNRIDEVGMLLRAVNQSGLNLRSLVDDVSLQATGVLHASKAVAEGHHTLRSRTEEAAASLEQTAAAVAEITANIQHNAANVRASATLAGSAVQAAHAGDKVVGQVATTMAQIAEASAHIGSIIGTVEGIAFQTNLLALNAAVEAARAGVQGRGFAVVAAEVRALAQRSAAAAKEIKTLVGQSEARVSDGAHLVESASATMQSIVVQVQQVAELMAQSSLATASQAGVLTEINTAIRQLDTMTQQNAVLVEQGSAAADGLKQRAGELAEAVNVFRSHPVAAPAANVSAPSAGRSGGTTGAQRASLTLVSDGSPPPGRRSAPMATVTGT